MRNMAEEANRWLSQAKEDLKWADHLAREGGFHLACFLAQQVAEKALKAFLYAQGEELVLGHSVARLCSDAARFNTEFNQQKRRWNILDTFYIPTRYPNGLPDGIPADAYTVDAANNAVKIAREVVDFIDASITERNSRAK